MKTSIVIPAYNEEETIGFVLRELKTLFREAEIIVVDDHSSDQTGRIAESAGAIVVRNEKNLGVTESTARGVEKSGGDIIIKIDADNEIPAMYAKELFQELKKHDVVIGKKKVFQRKAEIITSMLFSRFIGLSYGADMFPGVLVFKRKVYEKVGGYDSWDFWSIGFLFKTAKKGYKIGMKEITFEKRKNSRIGYSIKTELTVLLRTFRAFLLGYLLY